MGGIIGANNNFSPESMQYCYFLDTSAKKITDFGSTGTNCKSMTEEEMKSDDFIDLLNEQAGETIWEKDKENTNEGYPILLSSDLYH